MGGLIRFLASASLVLFCSAEVFAQAPSRDRREATVLRIDGDSLVVDVGASDGVGRGSIYTLFRPISVRHPVTGRVFRDRFSIGAVVLNNVSQTLSIAQTQGQPDRQAAVGDILVPDRVLLLTPATPVSAPASPTLPRAPAAPPESRGTPTVGVFAEPPVASASATAAGPATSSATQFITAHDRPAVEAWLATLGRSPVERVAHYRIFLRRYADSPYATNVRREIDYLSAARPAEAPSTQETPAQSVHAAGAPARVLRAGDPAVVALQIPSGLSVRGALLHARLRGETSYRTQALGLEGNGFLRGRLDSALVTPPGFQYFVEVTLSDGRSLPAFGSGDAPMDVEVEAPPEPVRPARGLSRIDLRAEYADVGSRTIAGVFRPQRFTVVEGDFLMRLRNPVLYGYRVGFGVYDGLAVPLAQLATVSPSVPSQVIYGYHELEFSPSDFIHIITRVQLGVHLVGLVVGAQLRMRIGDERKSNVVLGGELFREVGQRAFFSLNFHPIPALPMLVQGEVFNQSVAGGDPMFRFVTQIGYRFTSWFALSARGSYQLRNIENGGFGGGIQTTFDW